MSQSTDPTNAHPAPLTTAPVLGGAPLMGGESARSYEELLARICATLQPRDSLEEIWVRDIVDLVWEAFRLRRAKASLMTYAGQREIKFQLASTYPHAPQMAGEWAAGDADAASQVEQALASAGLSTDRVVAHGMTFALQNIERIERMLVSVEGRRGAALRELDRHRAPLGQKLRRAIAQGEVAELVGDAPRLAPSQPA